MDADESSPDQPSPDPSGGVGVRPSGRASLADLRLYRRAILNGWKVPAEAKRLAPARMLEVLKDDDAGERSWVAVSKVLVSMTGGALQSIDTALRVRTAEEVDKRLAEVERKLDASLEQPAATDEHGSPIEP